MRVVVLRVVGDVELFIWRNWLVHVFSFPKSTLPVEGTHVVEEDAALVR